MDIKNYIKDYRLLKISAKDIFESIGISRTTFNKMMKENGIPTNFDLYKKVDTGIKELDIKLKDRYSGIVKRCNGYDSYEYKDSYNDLEYLPLDEWVEFCMDNKVLLLKMWNRFTLSERDMRLAISIDRIDNSKGYFKDNMQFITNGLNSFKRNINPIKVTHKGEEKYFMSSKEASRHYGIRRNTIGDILRGEYRLASKDYSVKESNAEEVLEKNGVKTLNEYYEVKYIS